MRCLLVTCSVLLFSCLHAQDFYLFAGTYTTGKSRGIYVYKFNAGTGHIQYISSTDSCNNPSFLAISPDGSHVYAVNETGRENPGKVSAFAFDKTSGKLSFINQQLSGGDDPCFISIYPNGKWVAVGNYSGGSLSVLPIGKDGGLLPYAQLVQHTGSGPNKARQASAHVHSVFFSPDYRYILVPDLGMDKVMVYRFSPAMSQPIQPAAVPYIAAAPGSGPRHLAFHPDRKFVYRIEELSGTVTVSAWADGRMKDIQTIATHPADFKGQPGSADIHISPDGKFLYASNRGEENNIAIFAIHAGTGKLTAAGYQSTGGIQPRNFAIDPTGHYLLVANQKTDNLILFKRDIVTGQLQRLPGQVELPSPVCLQFLKP